MGRIPVLGVVLGSGCHDAIDAIDVPYLVQRDVVVHAIGWQVTSGYGNSSLYRKTRSPTPLRTVVLRSEKGSSNPDDNRAGQVEEAFLNR
jgi:hypothetical protein